ncbi:uncharacterized protein LOC126749093 [Anthonomus grandis grandis]|uniref:uncharacterized protein LOC126749093 n=1 Tax=Anthonomus grandis grandis TaxID=2921223 RepID=UPI002165ACBE|nr:uncharacterized protein LOC126749093 [Anthonomus grandis grandis]
MSTESEKEDSDPFHSSESEYQPSSQSSSSECETVEPVEVPEANGTIKKKKRDVKSWKRNMQKVKRAKGETYKSITSGKIVPSRTQGSDCKCEKECIKRLSPDEKNELFSSFNDQEKQDSYLSSLITVSQIKRRRKNNLNINPQRNYTYKYKLRKGAFELPVCKQALCLIHGIGKKRLERIASHLTANVTPVQDKRGKHGDRPNMIPKFLRKQVREHIESFPNKISHYFRARSSKQYLSPDLNLTIMYDLYLKKFEPENYKLKQDELPFKPKICYDFYGRYFRENFNISFGRPRKDTCKKCDMFENKIQGAESEEEKFRNPKKTTCSRV